MDFVIRVKFTKFEPYSDYIRKIIINTIVQSPDDIILISFKYQNDMIMI